MVTSNYDLSCRKAEEYYYDFLSSTSSGPIPDTINSHIEQCQQCQKKINRLKKASSIFAL